MSARRLFFLALLLFALWHAWNTRTRTHSPGTLLKEVPVQSPTNASKLKIKDFTLTPRAQFEIEARVLSRERYRIGRESELSPLDLALGWGPMSDTAMLDRIDISQGTRFYFWRTEDPSIPLQDIVRNSANMHMIPANDYVRNQLLDVQKGQLLRIEGQLVDIDGTDGWRWRTSLTRDDTGAGACEIVLIERLSLLP